MLHGSTTPFMSGQRRRKRQLLLPRCTAPHCVEGTNVVTWSDCSVILLHLRRLVDLPAVSGEINIRHSNLPKRAS